MDETKKVYVFTDARKDGTLDAKVFSTKEACFNFFTSILTEYGLVDQNDGGLVISPADGWGYVGSTIEDLFNEMITKNSSIKYHSGNLFIRFEEVQ